MSRPLEKLESEALDLPVSQRARLAQLLIASLDEEPFEDPAEVKKAWDEEIFRRLSELRAGKAKLIPAEKVLDELRQRHD